MASPTLLPWTMERPHCQHLGFKLQMQSVTNEHLLTVITLVSQWVKLRNSSDHARSRSRTVIFLLKKDIANFDISDKQLQSSSTSMIFPVLKYILLHFTLRQFTTQKHADRNKEV